MRKSPSFLNSGFGAIHLSIKDWGTAIFVWLALWQINLHASRDIHSYIGNYWDAKNSSMIERFIQMQWLKDPGYFVLQNISIDLLSFSGLMALIVGLAFLPKFLAFKYTEPQHYQGLLFAYLCTLSFLHEVTQIRTALATGVVLWALITWGLQYRLLAISLILIASLFHASAFVFLLPFTLLYLGGRLGSWIYGVAIACAAILAWPGLAPKLLLWLGEALDLRYLAYIRGAIARTLNTTGLFSYFFLVFVGFGLLIWKYFKPINRYWQQQKQLALMCCAIAIFALQIIRFNTVIASRIADLMLLPIAYVIGKLLIVFYQEQRKFFWLLVTILLAYAVIRGYVTLSPRAPPLMPTVD